MLHSNNTMSVAELQALLESTVHVLGDMDADGSNLRIQNGRQNFGISAIPFFSNQQQLLQSANVGQSVLLMSTKKLFELMPSAHFVLNPHSIPQQEFSPELIQQLLDGRYFAAAAKPVQPVQPKPVQQEVQRMGARFKSMLGLRKNKN